MEKEKMTDASFTSEGKPTKSFMFHRGKPVTTSLITAISAPISMHRIQEPYPPIRSRIIQNFLLVWLDASIDEINNSDCLNTITELRNVVHTINTFVDAEQCRNFLMNIRYEKAFMIVSGSLGQNFVPIVHDISHLNSIYIFCEDRKKHEHWVKKWLKIKGLFTEIEPICDELKQAAQQCDQDSIPISFVSTNDVETSNEQIDKFNQSFMYTQILKEILLDIDFDKKPVTDFTAYCRYQFANNEKVLNMVNVFERKYTKDTSIWWYTNECFLYPMLNRALRLMEVDTIIKMVFFIGDLHRQIAQLHKKQCEHLHQPQSFIVYRGQGLSKMDFNKMIKTKGGLISFNNFLSSSKKPSIALIYAQRALIDSDSVGVVFEMKIDPSISSIPFALINDYSFYKQSEQEILFAMHTVFRIGEVKLTDDKSNRLWEVELTLTSDNDQQVNALTRRMREETQGTTGWYCLGQLLIKLGLFDKAEELYKILLTHKCDENKKACVYHQLGYIKDNLGDYAAAISFHERSITIEKKIRSSNHLNMAMSYGNIGLVYIKMGEYTQALSFHEQALEIYQTALSPNHPESATSLNNIGFVYYKMENYSAALASHQKALKIYKETLPPNHPSLATSYHNIGLVHDGMSEYSEALWFYNKTLEIYRNILPPHHPDIAISYQNIGKAVEKMCEYSKALSYHHKALEIFQKTFPSDHPHLATCYSCIASVYNNMGDYSTALSFYEKVLGIREAILPSNHPDLIDSYNSIGAVYGHMSDYPNALSSYQKAMDINERTVPLNHRLIASSYNNFGKTYYKMNCYDKALFFLERAVTIGQRSLPSNHPDLQIYKNDLELMNDVVITVLF